MNVRFALLGIASLGIVGLSLAAAGRGGDAPAAPPLPSVTVAAVPEREVTDWREFTGRLEAVETVEVRPRVSGYVRRVAFEEGAEVGKGEVLFEIDPRPYAAVLAGAEARLERARREAELAAKEVERARRLIAVQAISREEYDSRTSAVAQNAATVRAAEAAVESARLDLEWTRVRAPIAGRVSRAMVTEGNLVQAGPPAATLLTTVVSLDPIYVYFDGDEQTYLEYGAAARAGSGLDAAGGRIPVHLGLANERGFPHEGHVDFVDNQLDPATGTIRLRAVFSNRDRRFTPGLFARVRLAGGGSYRAALVRDRAIGTDQDRKFVLVLAPDSTLEYRPVRLGPLADDLRVVTAGLEAGELVVVNGIQRVRPGMKVAWTAGPMAADSAAVSGEMPAPDSAAPIPDSTAGTAAR